MALVRLETLSSDVRPFPHALACHEALCYVLHKAVSRAIQLRRLRADEASQLLRIARQRDSGFVRLYVERVLELKEAIEAPKEEKK